jgi:hypothetical protein
LIRDVAFRASDNPDYEDRLLDGTEFRDANPQRQAEMLLDSTLTHRIER